MKKKLITAAVAAALMAALVFLFTGCGDIVDIGGNYEAKTSSEISEMLESADSEMTGSFEYKCTMTIEVGSEYRTTTDIDGVLNYTSATDFEFSGNGKISAKVENTSSSSKMSLYFDENYVYMEVDGTKVKTSLDTSGYGEQIVIGDVTEYIGNIDANAKFSVADEGEIKKIKIEMNITEEGITAPAEYYIIIENDKVVGFALKCNYTGTMEGYDVYMDIDIQMGATSKTVKTPSDLDSYVSIG